MGVDFLQVNMIPLLWDYESGTIPSEKTAMCREFGLLRMVEDKRILVESGDVKGFPDDYCVFANAVMSEFSDSLLTVLFNGVLYDSFKQKSYFLMYDEMPIKWNETFAYDFCNFFHELLLEQHGHKQMI